MGNHRSAFSSSLQRIVARIASAAAVATFACCCISAPALASPFETVATFAGSGEDVQLGGVGGMAVNVGGAGGVAPGTLYAATKAGVAATIRVARFSPAGAFELAWEVSPVEGPYERCGPLLGVDFEGKAEHPCPAQPNANDQAVDVDVDQANGNVYVFSIENSSLGTVRVYPPDGSTVITRFGAPGNGATLSSPDKIHGSPYPGGIAVNDSGEVYVYDVNFSDSFYHRLMVFRPKAPGVYTEYEYAGLEHDIGAGTTGHEPSEPVTDATANVYVAGSEGEYIEEYDPAQPAASICKFTLPVGGITAYTVNRETGELFYYTYKNKQIHQLSSCSEGKFTETGSPIAVKPERDDIYALAFNPDLSFTPGREPGVLYGGAPGPVPATGGKGEPGKTSLGYIFAPAEENEPIVESESMPRASESTAELEARIDPRGFPTRYVFQYLTEAEYQANEPDTVQALTVSAQAGTYTLTPTTAQGSGTLKSGSNLISAVSASLGSFRAGDAISAAGIPAGTTIVKIGSLGQLELSQNASASGLVQLSATETTAPIPYNAAAAGPSSVQAALNALPGVAIDEVSATGVAVSGGEESSPDQRAYSIVFSGPAFTNLDLPAMSADSSGLAGASHAATVQVTHHGGAGFAAGAEEAPPGGALLPGTGGAQGAAATLVGLGPDTAYRYRAVATSNCSPSEPAKVCEDTGAAQSFATAPSGASLLPDGRVYELVSPAQKNSGQVLPAEPEANSCLEESECKPGFGAQHFPMQSSPDGNAVLFEGDPFIPGQGAVAENEYLARRGATGWQSANLTPPQLQSRGGQGYKAFDAGLSEGLLEQTSPSLSPVAPPDFTNLYLQPSADPAALKPLLTNTNAFIHREPGNSTGGLKLAFAGASADLTRIFLEANDALTSEAGEAGEETNLYEASGGVLTQVNLAPVTGTPAPGSVLGSGTLLQSGNLNGPSAVVTHAISEDGSRAFWTGADGRTYVRVGASQTLEVPGPASCKASLALALRVCFLTASADGASVLLSNGQIYEFDEGAGAYVAATDLSGGVPGFQGILGQSEDLSRIYFVDTAVLTGEQQNEHGAKAQAGKDNLYAWAEGTTSYVATLLAGDNEAQSGDWQASPAVRAAEASPAGRYLTFRSQAPLSGYDNTDAGTGEADREVFLYDSQASGGSGRLLCPSCNPTNSRPLGGSTLRLILNVSGSLPQPRYLTDAGRLYFDSNDSLVPADTNGRAEDVYQYEPQGTGSCSRAGGCLAMISAGRAATDSNFLAIDATGDNAFFTTRERLVAADSDELIDLYDARVGGLREAPPSSSECQAEGCQPVAPAPSESAPTSSSFTGSGNVKPGCKKGQVKRKGRCVKKGHHHRKHHKHHKHHKQKRHAKHAKKNRGGGK